MSVESLLSALGMPAQREVLDLRKPRLREGIKGESESVTRRSERLSSSKLDGISVNKTSARLKASKKLEPLDLTKSPKNVTNSNNNSSELKIGSKKLKTCLLCAKSMIVIAPVPDNFDLLQLLCSTLNFPTIMPSLTEKNVSVANARFCEDCANTIIASRNVLRQIKLLEMNLDQLRDQLKKSIKYCIQLPNNAADLRDEESATETLVRNLFSQCMNDYSGGIHEVNKKIPDREHMEYEDSLAETTVRSLRRRHQAIPTSFATENILVEEDKSENGDDTLKDPTFLDTHDCVTISDGDNPTDLDDSEENTDRNRQWKSKLKQVVEAKPRDTPGTARPQVSRKKRRPRKPFECSECGKGYLSQEMYDAHMKTHTGQLEYACQHCDKKFALKKYLQLHNRTIHNIANSIRTDGDSCPHCGMDFLQFSEKVDATEEENSDSMFEKSVSEFSLTWSEEKKRRDHINTCADNPRVKYKNKPPALKIPCKLCEKQFSGVSSLESHVASIHEKKFKFYCEICAAGFVIMSDLTRHIEGVHSDERKYQCDTCDSSFKRQHQLFYHRRKHTGERPFICEVCGKGFHIAEKLRQHLPVHVTDKKCPCPLCGKMFKSHHYVRNHINTTHKGSRKGRQQKSNQTKSKNSFTMTSIPSVSQAEPDQPAIVLINENEIII